MVDDLLQQWLLEWLSGADPHLVLPTILGDHHSAQSVFGRRPGKRVSESLCHRDPQGMSHNIVVTIDDVVKPFIKPS